MSGRPLTVGGSERALDLVAIFSLGPFFRSQTIATQAKTRTEYLAISCLWICRSHK